MFRFDELSEDAGNGIILGAMEGEDNIVNGRWSRRCHVLISGSDCSSITLHYSLSKMKVKVNCQDVSQSVQGRDKSRRTYQSLWSILERMSFVQGLVEMSHSG